MERSSILARLDTENDMQKSMTRASFISEPDQSIDLPDYDEDF
jgi:hypothetical protein